MSEEGRINVELLEKKKTVHLEMDVKGCEYFIEMLQESMESNSGLIDYDPDTGYSCGILEKNSLGIMITIKDNN